MPSYFVETYLGQGVPGERTAREERARSAAREQSRHGPTVAFERSIHLPDDEVCFFVFVAPSGRDVAVVAERAGLDPLRVVEARCSDDDPTPPGGNP